MNSKRLFYVLCGLVILLAAGLFGGAYGANVLLQSSSRKVLEARSKIAALENQQSQLSKAKADVAKYKDIGDIAKSIVPQDKNQAQTVREIVNIASQNGLDLGSITFPSSTLGGTSAPASGATGGAVKAPSTAATSTSQLTPVPSIPGVYALQIILQSNSQKTVDYSKFLSFLDALEHNRRTALVSGVTITPDPKKPGYVSFVLTVDEYIKP